MNAILKKNNYKYNIFKYKILKFLFNLNIKQYEKIIKKILSNIDDNIIRDSFTNDKENKILLIGHVKEGDSLNRFVDAFLNTINYNLSEVHVYDEYTNNLYCYYSEQNRCLIHNCPINNISGDKYDLLLYLGVLNNGDLHECFDNKIPKNKPKLSFAYCVFDGTIPPQGWVDIINKYFDGIFVPIDFLKQVFETNGVKKPVFTLPISLDLQDYLQFLPKLNLSSNIKIGWIGTLCERKNPIKILKSFISIFADKPNIELHMHCRNIDNEPEYVKSFYEILKNAPANVIFTQKMLSEQEIHNLMKSFDIYIYMSKGEGYSNSVREALACGYPLLLSSIPSHSCITDLKEDDGIFWVNANKEVIAYQTSLNNQYIGKMFDIDEKELIIQMNSLIKQLDKLYSVEKIKIRKNVAQLYDKKYLKNVYKQILYPSKIEKSIYNMVTNDKLITSNDKLLNYYNNKFKVSIITASYNYDYYIQETIESVLAQTYQNWELIIVDDGSTDNSVNVIKSYCEKDSRIKLLQHENGINKGLAETIKLGIEKSNSDWIIFLESDDTLTSDYIEEKLKIIEKYPDIKFIFNDVNLIGDGNTVCKDVDSEIYFSKIYSLLNNTNFPANLAKEFYNFNFIPTFSCTMIKKSLFNNLNFNSPVKQWLDTFLWSQILKNNECYYIDKKLTNWRLHHGSYNHNVDSEYNKLLFKYKIKYNLGDNKVLLIFKFLHEYLWKYVRKKIISINFKRKIIKIFNKKFDFNSKKVLIKGDTDVYNNRW